MNEMRNRGYVLKPRKYKVPEVVARLQENRAKHLQAYDQACRDYADAVIEDAHAKERKFPEALARVLADFGNWTPGTPLPPVVYPGHELASFDLSPPTSYVHQYDVIIDQLQAGVEEEVELDDVSFRAFMRDEWDWSLTFSSSNAVYAERKSVGAAFGSARRG